jgi:tetratricopeptide (TPR) repeat protein
MSGNRAIAVAGAMACAALVAPRTSRAQDFLLEARAAAERGATDSAYTLLDRAVKAEPDRAEAHFWLAQVAAARASRHRSLGSFFLARKAKGEFARAVALDPANPVYLEGLGRYLARAPGIVGGDRDSAIRLARNLLVLDRMRGTSLLVEVYRRRGGAGDRERADSLIEAFAASPSGGREGRIRLVSFFAYTRRADRALPVAETLVAEDSTDAVGRYVLGSTLVALGRDPEAAARHLRWAIGHPPPITTDGRQFWPPGVWWRLGQAYAQLDQPDSARAAWQEALRLQPGFRPVRAALDSLARR